MYKILDNKVVVIEQFETITEVTSQDIKEQIDALKGSQVLSLEEEQYVESITMEDIVNNNVQARYTAIIDKLYPGKRGSNKNK